MESLLITANFEEKVVDGYFSLNHEWNIIKMDMITGNIFRKNPDKVIGKSIWMECPQLIGTDIEKALKETMEKQTVHSVRMSGIITDSWYNILACPTCDGISVCCQDMSNMVKAQSLLTQSQQDLSFQSHLLENVHDAICAVNKDSTIIYWNKYSEQLFGWTSDEIVGKSSISMFNTRFVGDTRNTIIEKLHSFGYYEGEIILRCKDGTEVAVHVHSKAITNSDNEICEVIHCFHDITERKRSEKELLESKTNALMLIEELHKADKHKNSFIATLSHELRNPLASIMMGVSLMESSTSLDEKALKACGIIKRQGQQLTRLVEDLLDVTRLTQNKIHLSLQQLELNELIARAVEDYNKLFEEKGVCLEVEYANEPITMNADEVRLTQVIGNLLSNSAKFTAKNGTTRIAITKDDSHMEAIITVSDNGIGIHSEFLTTMFKPFMQSDTSLAHTDGGLGLGLAIVKGIVELHNGTVSVSSDGFGKGTTFTLRLPVLPCKLEQIHPNLAQPSQKHRILLIDDNKDLLEIMSEMMDVLGYEPIAASDGMTGIAKAKEYMPDVILCDIGLPVMNGYEIASRISNDITLRHIPLIAMTGYARPEDKIRSAEAGFQRHLSKPVDINVLKHTLETFSK